MSQNLTHLQQTAENSGEQSLPELADYVALFKAQKARVEALEEELAEAKKAFQQTAQEDIPNLLLQNGFTKLHLLSGETLTIKTEIAPTIKNMAEFAEFLAARGDDDILKTKLELGKVPAELLAEAQAALAALGLAAIPTQTVHPGTLKKYIREICRLESGLLYADEAAALQDLPECISVYTYYKTTLK